MTFWSLLVVAVLSAGSLDRSVTAAPSAGTGALVAVSGVLLLGSILLASRILFATERARRRTLHSSSGTARRTENGS